MDGEILFRKSLFGGFNREDVMKYISQNSVDKSSLESAQKKLESAEKELEQKNAEAESLKAKIAELEELVSEKQNEEEQAKALRPGFDTTADKLMRESMSYAQQYVESAELMARNIRENIILKASDADLKVSGMLDSVEDLIIKSEDFETALKDFKADFEAIKKSFEEDKKSE